MSTLVLGAGGMLGSAVVREARSRGEPVEALGHAELDILDAERVKSVVDSSRPTAIVNCAALTAVDDCESRQDEAMAINGEAVGGLAREARHADALLVQVSSDFVFDGRSTRPYVETDTTGPLSVYGRSKLEGERRALEWEGSLVLRTSWLFGPGGANFVAAMRRLMDLGEKPLRVVSDQIGCPTYTGFLARAIWDLVRLRTVGILHYRNRRSVSWHEFAARIAAALGDPDEVVAISSEDLARPAPRPRYSVLDVSRFEGLVGRSVEDWESGLMEYLQTTRGRGLS